MIPTSEDAQTILKTLLEIGVFASAIFAAIMGFRLAFKNRIRPALRFALWFLLLLRLTVPFTVNSAVHLIVLPAKESVSVPVEAQAETTVRPVTPAAVAVTPKPSVQTDPTPAPKEEEREVQKTATRLTVWQILPMIWIAGAIVLLVRRLWMRGLLAARLRAGARIPDAETMREFRNLCGEMRIRRAVRILEVPDVTSPALTIGLRPTVLLPTALLGADRERERRFALLHELTHLKRCDHWVMLWYGILRCVWWFHPIVWLMEKSFRTDMESACDAKAVRSMNAEEKLLYATLLLELGKDRTL